MMMTGKCKKKKTSVYGGRGRNTTRKKKNKKFKKE